MRRAGQFNIRTLKAKSIFSTIPQAFKTIGELMNLFGL
jgi:hypothetical protein